MFVHDNGKFIISGMDWKIMQEVQHVIDTLDNVIDNHHNGMTNGDLVPYERFGIMRSVEEFFDLPDLNVIWELVAGIR